MSKAAVHLAHRTPSGKTGVQVKRLAISQPCRHQIGAADRNVAQHAKTVAHLDHIASLTKEHERIFTTTPRFVIFPACQMRTPNT
jgi:hypothetical protein